MLSMILIKVEAMITELESPKEEKEDSPSTFPPAPPASALSIEERR